ncbi:hypothetical protein LCGC14_3133800 [marine sediment metagenome]|uniref:Uncharacterized protein n=1 Tax=marine sediment metagenome TaxID=412755 RepID=A0A0F8WMU0_9ZZZZ
MRTITVFESVEELLDALEGKGEQLPADVGLEIDMGTNEYAPAVHLSGPSHETCNYQICPGISATSIVREVLSRLSPRIKFHGGPWDNE